MTTTAKSPIKAFDYKAAAQSILRTLKRDRDRQILAKRFGFDLARRQTLEQIGQNFGITRERVRQIEKATLAKIKTHAGAEVEQANRILSAYLKGHGGVTLMDNLAKQLGANTPEQQAYVYFLASLSPDVNVMEEDDLVRASLGLLPVYTYKATKELIGRIIDALKEIEGPAKINELSQKLGDVDPVSLAGAMPISKQLAHFDDNWGLASWPQVNPRSIRDKTYLVLGKHGQPMHFTKISDHIRNSEFKRRDVTVQAVHNELIKDPRFVLIGRGIYALAEWGYAPGTVADIIIEVLRDENAPLHKDEIVKRVLKKRQVRTTTIILNLQEKGHFERVAKATYKLKDPT